MRKFVLLAVLLTLSACLGGRPQIGGPGVEVVRAGSLPVPDANDVLAANRSDVIGAFDKLSIDIFGLPDLSQKEIQVDAGGKIAVPLVGSLSAGGRTTSEVAEAIEQGLRKAHVRDPRVAVNMVETVSRVVTVDGEVKQPGIYPVTGQMSLMRAVARAQGLSEFARQQDVLVFRTVNNQRLVGVYDLRAIRAGTYEDPPVYANDVVVVGDSPARRTFRTLVEGAALLSPLVILVG